MWLIGVGIRILTECNSVVFLKTYAINTIFKINIFFIFLCPMKVAESYPKRSTKRKYEKGQKYSVSKLLKPLGVETKFYDTFSHLTTSIQLDDDPTNVTTNVSPADMDSFNAVEQGDLSYMREGRQITMKSIQLKGVVNFPATSTAGTVGAMAVRLVLLVDHQNNNGPSVVVWNSVFELSGYEGGAGTFAVIPARLAIMDYRALRTGKRYTILWDEMIQYRYDDPYVTTEVGGSATVIKTNGGKYWFHIMRDLNDMVVNYSTTNGDATDIVDNNIIMLAFALPVTSGATLPTLDYVSRLRFRG